MVSSSGDRSRKRRADDDRSRGDYSKIPKEEHIGMRRGDSEPREDSRNDNVTYPIPSAMTRDRGIKHQDDMRPGMYPHDDRRGRRGSPLRDHRRGRGYRDRYRDDRPRHERREDRERMGSRRARCRDYDGMLCDPNKLNYVFKLIINLEKAERYNVQNVHKTRNIYRH